MLVTNVASNDIGVFAVNGAMLELHRRRRLRSSLWRVPLSNSNSTEARVIQPHARDSALTRPTLPTQDRQ